MGKVIDNEQLSEHSVKKFQFTPLEVNEDTKTHFNHALFSEETSEEQEDTVDEKSCEINPDADALYLKIDALASDKVELQMQLETLQKELDNKIQTAQDEAYAKGKEEGIKETNETFQNHNDELNIQLVKSLTALDEELQKYSTFLTAIEDELVDASIMIAQKIVKKELEESSSEVAKILADRFIQDLQEADSITLKVNPQDAAYLQEHYKNQKNIKIDADDAINKGGIIILSDIGNIDGNIETRVEKAIALIKREG